MVGVWASAGSFGGRRVKILWVFHGIKTLKSNQNSLIAAQNLDKRPHWWCTWPVGGIVLSIKCFELSPLWLYNNKVSSLRKNRWGQGCAIFLLGSIWGREKFRLLTWYWSYHILNLNFCIVCAKDASDLLELVFLINFKYLYC